MLPVHMVILVTKRVELQEAETALGAAGPVHLPASLRLGQGGGTGLPPSPWPHCPGNAAESGAV